MSLAKTLYQAYERATAEISKLCKKNQVPEKCANYTLEALAFSTLAFSLTYIVTPIAMYTLSYAPLAGVLAAAGLYVTAFKIYGKFWICEYAPANTKRVGAYTIATATNFARDLSVPLKEVCADFNEAASKSKTVETTEEWREFFKFNGKAKCKEFLQSN